MARPRKPLISRRATLEAALQIIDEEGLEALTIRRLGRALKIQGISLYYHFKDKDEILAGAAALALSGVRTPDPGMTDWREWLLRNAIEYRRALCRHPNLIPILMRRHALGIGLAEHNATAGLLAAQGVPADAIMPLVEALEEVALGSASHQAGTGTALDNAGWKEDFPILYHLSLRPTVSKDRLFELIAHATIEAVMSEVAAGQQTESVRQ